jgi:hypothetical protein
LLPAKKKNTPLTFETSAAKKLKTFPHPQTTPLTALHSFVQKIANPLEKQETDYFSSPISIKNTKNSIFQTAAHPKKPSPLQYITKLYSSWKNSNKQTPSAPFNPINYTLQYGYTAQTPTPEITFYPTVCPNTYTTPTATYSAILEEKTALFLNEPKFRTLCDVPTRYKDFPTLSASPIISEPIDKIKKPLRYKKHPPSHSNSRLTSNKTHLFSQPPKSFSFYFILPDKLSIDDLGVFPTKQYLAFELLSFSPSTQPSHQTDIIPQVSPKSFLLNRTLNISPKTAHHLPTNQLNPSIGSDKHGKHP